MDNLAREGGLSPYTRQRDGSNGEREEFFSREKTNFVKGIRRGVENV